MINADEIYAKVIESGTVWADCKAAYELLDDMSKTILADITSNFMPPVSGTKSEAEMRALASADYKNHLASKGAARKLWLHAQVAYDGVKMLAELRRSEESTNRAQMNMR